MFLTLKVIVFTLRNITLFFFLKLLHNKLFIVKTIMKNPFKFQISPEVLKKVQDMIESKKLKQSKQEKK